MLEEQIQFAICPALWFRKPEVHPNNHATAGPHPEEGGVRTPIPRRLTELVVGQDVDNDVADVVERAGQNDRFAFRRVEDNSETNEYVTGPTVKS